MDSNAPLTNILEVVVPLIAIALIGTPVVISGLKGRWWMGVVGVVGVVGGFVVFFGAFGMTEPSAEFQETFAFQLMNVALNIAFIGGLALLIAGAMQTARPESWWDRHRGGISAGG